MTATAIDDEPVTRDEIITALGFLNETAKAMSRRGYVGTMSAEYAVAHGRIDQRLGDLERAGL